MEKAVFYLSIGPYNSTCQNPLLTSIVPKFFAPERASKKLDIKIKVKGYVSLTVMSFNFLYSTQNLVDDPDPSFLGTQTTGEVQGLDEGSITT